MIEHIIINPDEGGKQQLQQTEIHSELPSKRQRVLKSDLARHELVEAGSRPHQTQ